MPPDSDPYRPPSQPSLTADGPRRDPAGATFLSRAMWAYPIALTSCVYGTWLLATVVLGHTPRPNLDDPKDLGLSVVVAGHVTGVVMVGSPGAMMFGAVFLMMKIRRAFDLTRILVFALLWTAVLTLMRFDPLRVVEWLMD